MCDYDTVGPHGTTTCIMCFEDISGDVAGPYCSAVCRRENRSPGRANDYLTDEQLEATNII